MRKNLNSLLAASALMVGLVLAPALYAQGDPTGSRSPMADQGMMGDGMMQDGNMQEMMGMMRQMNEMMETCNEMMRSMMAAHNARQPEEEQDRTPGQRQGNA